MARYWAETGNLREGDCVVQDSIISTIFLLNMIPKEHLFTPKSACLLPLIPVQFTMLYRLRNLFNIE
jgi:hypothetical protein